MDKYYVPDIEDIRVGYECETLVEVQQTNSTVKEWKKIKLSKNILKYAFSWIDFNKIRTPYLTIEQIEAEGWVHKYDSVYTKMDDNHKVYLQVDYNWYDIPIVISIFYSKENYRFCGSCPSINEFRTIMKLLKI